MTATAWLGVDPGMTDAGLVLRAGPDLLAWRVVHRGDDEGAVAGKRSALVGPAYLGRVAAAVDELVAIAEGGGYELRAAVEWMNAPSGFARGERRNLNPQNLTATALATGHALAHLTARGLDPVLIQPGHAGENMLITYPEQLVTPTERRSGLHRKSGRSNPISHAREAWDVAGHGPAELRRRDAVRAYEAGMRELRSQTRQAGPAGGGARR